MRDRNGGRIVRIGGRIRRLFIPAFVMLAGFALCVGQWPYVDIIRNLVFDAYQRIEPRPRSQASVVRIVDIDDESIARLGQWPWPRTILADLSDRLAAAGAVAVGYDIVFGEPDRLSPASIVERLPASPERDALARALIGGQSNDAVFAAALGKVPSVLGMIATPEKTGVKPTSVGVAFGGDDPRLWLPHYVGAIQPIEPLARSGATLGSIVFIPDRDLIVRKVNLLFNVGPDAATGTIVPSLDAALLRDAQGASTLIVKSSNASGQQAFGMKSGVTDIRIGALSVPTDRTGAVRIRYGRDVPELRVPAWTLLESAALPDFEGKIVLVGTSATALADIRSTPIDAVVPGVAIHAELIENLLEGVQLVRPDYVNGLEGVMLLMIAILAIALSRLASPVYSAAGVAAMSIGVWTASFLMFRHADLLVDPLIPSLTAVAVFGASTIAQYRRSVRERKQIRGAFSRYVAPGVIANLERNPAKLRLGGETRTVSILFCDARNFTSRSETLDAAGVVHFLNSLHTPLTACVLDSDGTIDKYIGDGLMAFWNAPHDVPNHASQSCAAALAMMAAIPRIDAALHDEALADGRPHIPLAVGIGISTGQGFVGNMGSDQRFDYSVVGDSVNVAARFESATKEYGVDIIVSAETAANAPGFVFIELEGISLKGKSEPVQALALHGARISPPDPDLDAYLNLHRQALQAMRNGGDDAPAAIDAAASHPLAAPYQTLYGRWRTRLRLPETA